MSSSKGSIKESSKKSSKGEKSSKGSSKHDIDEVPKYEPGDFLHDYFHECVTFVMNHLPKYFRNHESHDLSDDIIDLLFDDMDCESLHPIKPSSENITRILHEL